MQKEIVNRVANSKLVTLDLEDFYPEGKRTTLDISQWLWEGIVLKEKEFRSYVEAYDWSQYQDSYIALQCNTDAIIPGWAYMYVSLKLTPYAKKIVVGSLETLESILFSEIITAMDISEYINKPVIVKGCANKPIPQNAFVLLSNRLHSVAKSVMYGEACSFVPLFKKK